MPNAHMSSRRRVNLLFSPPDTANKAAFGGGTSPGENIAGKGDATEQNDTEEGRADVVIE